MADKNIEEMTFKEASIELEQIVRSLEAGDLELEESLERSLTDAEQKVRVLLDATSESAPVPDTVSAPSTAFINE